MKRFMLDYWGYMGDIRPVSSPDGVASVAWPILRAFQEEGYQTFWGYQDRDAEMFSKHGPDLFGGPCAAKRLDVYRCLQQTGGTELPELDILLHEWRWHIPGYDQSAYMPRQEEVLNHYLRPGSTTKVIIWDGDQKMTAEDERRYPGAIIAESALRPKFLTRRRESLIYCCDSLLLAAGQGNIKDAKRCEYDLTYVGNRYERDEDIEKWLAPVPPHRRVAVYGKWEPQQEVKARWPHITFGGRIDMKDFAEHMSSSVAVPLLAKPAYHEGGQVTLRAFEALAAGTIPIGLSTFLGAHLVTPRVAIDASDLVKQVNLLRGQTLDERRQEHMRCVLMMEKWSHIEFYKRVCKICSE